MNGFRIAVLLAIVTATETAGAAEEIGLGVAYDPRAPVGNFRGVVPDAGFGGVQAKWDYFPIDELSIGVGIQYNNFRRSRPLNETPGPNGAMSSPTYRNVSFCSFLPTVRYYLSTSSLRPYAELGVGLSNATGAVLINDLTRRDVITAFIVQPSLGVLVPVAQDGGPGSTSDGDASVPAIGTRRRPRESLFGVTLSVTYAFTTADVGGATNVAYAGFQIGIYAKP